MTTNNNTSNVEKYESLIQRYEKLKSLVVDRKAKFDEFMKYIEATTAYLITPSSTKYHLACTHGLLEHCINVTEKLLEIKNLLAPDITDESCVIVGLLHDLGKAGVPGKPYYRDKEPTERQKQYGYKATPPYEVNPGLVHLSVPARSLYLTLSYLPLTEVEAQAILYHDGQYIDDNKSVAAHEEKLTLMLQYADTWSAFVTEKED